MQELVSSQELGAVIPNISIMLQQNATLYKERIAYQEKNEKDDYQGISWDVFYSNIQNIAANLRKYGFSKGDKMVLFSSNRLEMLELELAVIASGGVAVPIFAFFKQETAMLLINHSNAKFLAVAGDYQLQQLDKDLKMQQIFVFDKGIQNTEDDDLPSLVPFSELLIENAAKNSSLDFDILPDTICLNMYTSGTMGVPKCVQLTHKNVLSQQAALKIVWDITKEDRFLAYLPWHHSFGGIFELFSALYNGATYSLESGLGKNPQMIMSNWMKVKPTLFFSVPQVYKNLLELTQSNKEYEKAFFNSGLKFIFTAAAALPEKLSNEFEARGIPVIEGWGLTETSPCCTLTNSKLKRETGVVGMPIPGVKIRIAEDEEIQVTGPNIMVSYYNSDEANKDTFTEDGWFRTGDVGQITENGLKLISRKDRIFKLSNGEKVIPTDLEKQIEFKCHYVSYAIVSGGGQEYPVALIFPNKKLLESPDYNVTPIEGCFCPRTIDEMGKCLTGCLHKANNSIGQKFAKVQTAAIINGELSLEEGTLTPSMKVAPKNVLEKYKKHLKNLYGDDVPVDEEVYVIKLNK